MEEPLSTPGGTSPMRVLLVHPSPLLYNELYMCFFQAEDGIRDLTVTGVQTCALPISEGRNPIRRANFAGSELKQRPDFVIVPGTKVEIGRHNSDDGIRLAIEQHGSADDEGIAAKLRLPESKTDRKSTRLNSSHSQISYAVFCLKKKNN